MDTVYEASLRPLTSDKDRYDLEDQLFAVQKTAHRLQEQAGEAENESRKAGHKTDKSLMLIEQGCMSVDIVLAAASRFLVTDDRTFVGIAAVVRPTITTILKAY
jgi:hypothetical protein